MGGETGLYSPVFENALLLAESRWMVTTELAPTVTMNADMKARKSPSPSMVLADRFLLLAY